MPISYLDYKKKFFEIPTERYENEDYNHTDSIHASIFDQSLNRIVQHDVVAKIWTAYRKQKGCLSSI
jgi:uridine kinase